MGIIVRKPRFNPKQRQPPLASTACGLEIVRETVCRHQCSITCQIPSKRAKTWKERLKSFYPVNPPTRRRGSDFVLQQLRSGSLLLWRLVSVFFCLQSINLIIINVYLSLMFVTSCPIPARSAIHPGRLIKRPTSMHSQSCVWPSSQHCLFPTLLSVSVSLFYLFLFHCISILYLAFPFTAHLRPVSFHLECVSLPLFDSCLSIFNNDRHSLPVFLSLKHIHLVSY